MNFYQLERTWSAGLQALGKLKFFSDGFGTPGELRELRTILDILKNPDYCLPHIERCRNSIKLVSKRVDGDFLVVDGEYISPVNDMVSASLWPQECRIGYFQLLLPKAEDSKLKGVVIQTAGTERDSKLIILPFYLKKFLAKLDLNIYLNIF